MKKKQMKFLEREGGKGEERAVLSKYASAVMFLPELACAHAGVMHASQKCPRLPHTSLPSAHAHGSLALCACVMV